MYQEIYFKKVLKGFRFISYINDHKSENRDLLILTNIGENHWRLAYYNHESGKINTNFKINDNYIPKNFENSDYNKFKNTINTNDKSHNFEQNNNKKQENSSIFSLKYLLNLDKIEILKYYDSPDNNIYKNIYKYNIYY